MGDAISSAKVAGKIDSGNNGSYDGEADFNGRNPSDSVYQESEIQANSDDLLGQAPPPSVVSGCYTLDNRDADSQLYDNLNNAEQRNKPAYQRDGKSASVDAGKRILRELEIL